ncbi:GHKL domain-containing protein [Sulfurimonas aquatica]|uniref:histidine kinase n=1 Tax=Sulfurimonas aquatica TaxID=2672570 RepID=A0A975GC55_9BACT|nr:HAMP domain-containing sensor histidine kinase [Sulfurimonas aquatica]QSZ41376.1 GHKL domain-containing protein [Sulfurimonas aquatica]
MFDEIQREKIDAEKLDSLKSMMDNIAHQWRQPLSQINSSVSMIDKILYDKGINEPLIEEKLLEIEALTKYMSNTIDDFRGYFAQNTLKTKANLNETLQDAIEMFKPGLQEKSITLKANLMIDAQHECYHGELKQIIIVLLNNAKDALLNRNTYNAKIELELTENESEYLIAICDNAGGITKSVMSKIFEPYYTTKHKSQGTGLGLYMAKKILNERLDGSLNVKNQNDGSCFYIALPKE